MTSNHDHVIFSHVRKILLDLGFVETTVPGPYFRFEHSPSGTLLFYRPYRPHDLVTWADQVKTRKFLDERGIVGADEFEALLSRTNV